MPASIPGTIAGPDPDTTPSQTAPPRSAALTLTVLPSAAPAPSAAALASSDEAGRDRP